MSRRTETLTETALHFSTHNKVRRKSEESFNASGSGYAFDTDVASNHSHPEQIAA